VSVGFAASLALDAWANRVMDVFRDDSADFSGGIYLVGSAARGKDWRDVDVVVILDDEVFVRWFGDWSGAGHTHDPKWAALMAAFCAWGTAETGLPIDFKVQKQTEANRMHGSGTRSALGLRLTPPARTEGEP